MASERDIFLSFSSTSLLLFHLSPSADVEHVVLHRLARQTEEEKGSEREIEESSLLVDTAWRCHGYGLM